MIDLRKADVTGNGVVSSYDAAHILYRVFNPSYRFPVEGGSLPKLAASTPRVLSWLRDDDDWALVADDATGIGAGEFVMTLSRGTAVRVSAEGEVAFNQEGRTLRVAFARLNGGGAVLFRIEGAGNAPEIGTALLNEGQIPVVGVRQPAMLALYQNAPNPFNPSTTIRFSIPAIGHAYLAVYDANGRLVQVLVNGELAAGADEVAWDGTDAAGRPAASGIYLIRLTTSSGAITQRATLVR